MFGDLIGPDCCWTSLLGQAPGQCWLTYQANLPVQMLEQTRLGKRLCNAGSLTEQTRLSKHPNKPVLNS